MIRASVFERAAELIDTGKEGFSCLALDEAEGNGDGSDIDGAREMRAQYLREAALCIREQFGEDA